MRRFRLFLRLLVASILLATSLGKLLDVPGFVGVLRTYQAFPEWLLGPLAVFFVLVELHLAEWLFWGRYLRQAAAASIALHLLFVVQASVTLARGIPVPNCGCFGVFFARPLTLGTVLEDLVMVAVSVALFLTTSVFAALPPDADFKPYHEEDGVKVGIVQKENGPPWVRGTGEIDASAADVGAVISRFDGYQDFLNGMVEKVKVLEAKPGYSRLHMTYHYPWPLKNRDAVAGYHFEKTKDGKQRAWWSGEAKPGDPEEGVRIENIEGETLVTPLGPKKSKVVYTYIADLGGSFGDSIKEKAYKKEAPHYFSCLKKALKLTAP